MLQGLRLALGPEVGRDRGPEATEVALDLGRGDRAPDDRRDRRMAEGKLQRRCQQRDAVAAAERLDPPRLLQDLG